MLATEIENLVAGCFGQFQFRQVDASTFEVIVPVERLPLDSYRDLWRELSAKTTVYGPGFRDVTLEGQYKGRRVKLRLLAEGAAS